MAREDTHKSAPEARVYRTNEVHKRRVGRVSPAPKEEVAVPVEAAAAVEPSEAGANKAAEINQDEKSSVAGSPGVSAGVPPRDSGTQIGKARTVQAEDPAEAEGEARDLAGHDEDPDAADMQQDVGEEADRQSSKKSVRSVEAKRGRAKRWAIIVLAVLVVLVVAWASFFAWNRWGRYDDTADIQGQWYVDGTAAPIVIDGETMQLDDNVAYHYELDTREKTIRFSFGSWEGQGRYRFSDDRQRLLIIDGEYSGLGNLFQDLFVSFDEMAKTGARVVAEAPQDEPEASSAAASDGEEVDSGSAQESSGQAAPSSEAAQQANGQENAADGVEERASGQDSAASGGAQQGSAQLPATDSAVAPQDESESGLGQGVSLFNRQADPEALKAKEEAEKEAQAKAEREAKEAAKAEAEAEAAEGVDYGYYDPSEYIYEDEGEEGAEEYYSDEDEEA